MATNKKPTALKILHGDFAKNPQRRNRNEPTPEPAIPPCHDALHGEARDEWERVTKELAAIKVITDADRAAVHQYAETWGLRQECLEAIKKDGMFYTTEHGISEHPAAKAASRYGTEIRQYLQQFGLTPAARANVNVVKPAEPTRMRRQR